MSHSYFITVTTTKLSSYFQRAFLQEHLAPQPFTLLQVHFTSSLQEFHAFRSICIYIATLVRYDQQAKSLELADAIAIVVYSVL